MNEFISQWLQQQDSRQEYGNFEHRPIVERPNVRQRIMEPLARHIFSYHRNPESYRRELLRHMETLRYADAVDAIASLPKSRALRNGGFGEVLACEFLRQRMGCMVPVYRLRYRQHSQVSPPGEDLIAINIDSDNDSREVFIGEAKVRKQFRNEVVEEAYSQIEKVKPRPESLTFILEVLIDKDEELHDQLLDIGNRYSPNPFTRCFFLLLVTENTPRNPFDRIAQRNHVVQNLMASDIVIENLGNFVDELFELAPTLFSE